MNSGALAAMGILAFATAAYPQTEYTAYLGGAVNWQVARVRADAAGNTVIAGNRASGTLTEMFVARLDRSGQMASFLSFGGNGGDTIADMAIDPAGNIVLAGWTTSTSFPLVQPMQSNPGPGFVVKLNAAANQILFATYFPGAVSALATDTGGNLYLTGSTLSADFPVTPGLPAGHPGGQLTAVTAAFLTKISAAGDRILYSTTISGSNKNCGCCSSCFLSARHTAGVAVAVDSAGNAYLAGNTDTTDLPVTSGVLLQNGVGAFVAKINAAGTALSYLTYIGATYYPVSPNTNAANVASAIAVDSSGSAYLAGATSDPDFPATAGAYQTVAGQPGGSTANPFPPSDAFVLKLKPDGSGVVWATYLGGPGVDEASGLALDSAGNAWIAGTTASANFPNAQGWSTGDEFIAAVSASGASLAYAARYPSGTVTQSLAIDASGLLHVAGSTGLVSVIAPSGRPLPRIFGIANAAYGQAGGVMARGELISIFGPHIGPATPVPYTPTAAGMAPTSLGGVQVLMGDYAMPLLYVSDSQINAVAPFSLYGGVSGLTLQVVNNGVATPLFGFSSIDSDPQIFQNADGSAAAVNEDGSLNSAAHPAPAGSIVSIWITGVGTSSAYLQDGQIATGPLAFTCCSTPANIVYSGAAPGAVAGVVQINFEATAPLYGSNITPVIVTVGSNVSRVANIYTSQ